jgi:GR25 family glycosyltransferase involved in LPS biosynthesis
MKKYSITTIYLISSMFAISLAVGFIFYVMFTVKEAFEEKAKKYLDGVDIIYWINLDRSADRKASMEKMLTDEAFDGIPNQRIKAYDGKMDPESVFKKIIVDVKKQTDLEYACLLSHLESIRTFNESPYNVALIFEDDVTLEFKKYWKKTVQEIMDNAPSDWDMILLSYIYYHDKSDIMFKTWDNNPDYDKAIGNYYSSLSYIINKSGSEKILNIYRNGKYYLLPNVTYVTDVYFYQATNAYAYKYPMFIFKTNNNSTIHQNHVSYHDASKKIIENNYKKMENKTELN